MAPDQSPTGTLPASLRSAIKSNAIEVLENKCDKANKRKKTASTKEQKSVCVSVCVCVCVLMGGKLCRHKKKGMINDTVGEKKKKKKKK